MRQEKLTTLIHLLDSWYKPERIEKLLLRKQELEKLKDEIVVEESPETDEIRLITNQWKSSRLGRIYRSESVTVIPLGSDYVPKSAIIVYGPFRDKEAEEYMIELLNNFVEKTNKSIKLNAVKIIRDPYGLAMGFEATSGWEGVMCSIRELEEKIYGSDIDFKLYGTD